MTYYRVDPAGCARTFSEVERHLSAARKKHESVSQDVDEARELCAKGEAAQVASALSRVYNDALTTNMRQATTTASQAVSGARRAVAAIQAGDHDMVEEFERAAGTVDEIKVTDRKPS